jgi:hypothetical protein
MILKTLKEGAALSLNGFLFKRDVGDRPVSVGLSEQQALQYASFFEEESLEKPKKIKETGDAK